jgi:hypothetical protein
MTFASRQNLLLYQLSLICRRRAFETGVSAAGYSADVVEFDLPSILKGEPRFLQAAPRRRAFTHDKTQSHCHFTHLS